MKRQEIVAQTLKANGFDELPSNSRKYRKFTSTRKDSFHFVGRAGAVRVGKNISNSISITASINYKKLGQRLKERTGK